MASLLKFVQNGVFHTASRSLSLLNLGVSNGPIVCYSNVSKFNRILQKLGIPEKPKRPLTGYIRFMQENELALKQISQSQNEYVARVGAQWRQMSEDQKEKYNKEYKREMVEYKTLRDAYMNKLTPQQKQAIKDEQKEQRDIQTHATQKRTLKNELLSLGKPKRPLTSYMLFAVAKAKETNLTARDFKNEWGQMSDDQKQVYNQKARQLADAYEGELKVWEDQMMAEGKPHLVRKSRFLAKTTKRRKSSKQPKTE